MLDENCLASNLAPELVGPCSFVGSSATGRIASSNGIPFQCIAKVHRHSGQKRKVAKYALIFQSAPISGGLSMRTRPACLLKRMLPSEKVERRDSILDRLGARRLMEKPRYCKWPNQPRRLMTSKEKNYRPKTQKWNRAGTKPPRFRMRSV